MRLTLAALLACTASSIARAQDASEAEVALARREFDRCVGALERDRADEAARHCRASLEIHDNAPAVYNLGLALKRLERPNEARAAFEALLAGRYGPLDESRESEVRAQLAAVRAQLVAIVVTVRGGSGTVSIGGVAHSVARGGEVEFAELDPGTHEVVLEAGPHRERRAIAVREGTARAVFVVPAPIDAPAPAISEEGPDWLVPVLLIGGAVLLVGGGVALAIALVAGGQDGGDDGLLSDAAFGTTFALE